MKALRSMAIVAAASLIAISGVSPTVHARQRARPDEGGIAGTGIPALTTTRVVSAGITRPIYVTHAPGDATRVFIIEKRGLIRVLKIDVDPPVLLAAAFLDIDSQIVGGTSQASEQGLLGLAFHPNYQSNGYFYVYYTALSGADTVARFQVSGNPDLANGSGTPGAIVLSQPDNESNHNGGWIGFKPGDTQGYLYVAIGDGGAGCDVGPQHDATTGNGQSLNTLFGKMLRLDIDGIDNIVGNVDDDSLPGDPNKNYAIPPTNPFASTAGLDEIWAYGLRNHSRCSFDRATGDLYIGDVGQGAWEEINFEPSNSAGGRNYGWRCMEGNHPSSDSGCSTAGCVTTACGGALVCPVHEYANDGATCAVTGGYVYRGARMPLLHGTYFFADYNCSIAGPALIWSFKLVGGVVTNFQSRGAELDPDGAGIINIDTLTSFGEDLAGEIYICDQEGGEIFKIVPVPCFADIDPDGARNINDLLMVINNWGPCGVPCPADIDGGGSVEINDLLAVINNWGTCP